MHKHIKYGIFTCEQGQINWIQIQQRIHGLKNEFWFTDLGLHVILPLITKGIITPLQIYLSHLLKPNKQLQRLPRYIIYAVNTFQP